MPNVMTVLKDEIVRLARKEVKCAADPLKAGVVSSRKTLADLSKRVAALEKAMQMLSAPTAGATSPVAAGADAGEGADESTARITARTISTLRRRLKFSRKEFATLVGVSEQNVYLWERKKGVLRVREATRNALLAARDIGVREARARLAAAQG